MVGDSEIYLRDAYSRSAMLWSSSIHAKSPLARARQLRWVVVMLPFLATASLTAGFLLMPERAEGPIEGARGAEFLMLSIGFLLMSVRFLLRADASAAIRHASFWIVYPLAAFASLVGLMYWTIGASVGWLWYGYSCVAFVLLFHSVERYGYDLSPRFGRDG